MLILHSKYDLKHEVIEDKFLIRYTNIHFPKGSLIAFSQTFIRIIGLFYFFQLRTWLRTKLINIKCKLNINV
jgi:hypothetical protein